MKKVALIIGSMIAGGIVSAASFIWFAKAKPPVKRTSTAERKILFWYGPVYPDIRFDKPGESPFMDANLVPKCTDEKDSASSVRIDSTQMQSLGVKAATVTRGPLTFTQGFPANVGYNEYQHAIVQARTAGFIDKVHLLTVGDKVQRNTPPLGLTIPDWVEAQSEYLLLRETGGMVTQTEDILERLQLAGVPEADIRRLIATQKIQARSTLKTPIDGVITAFDLRAGMNIAKDNVITKIQGMDPVWVTVTIPESITWLVKDASQFTLTVPARPDKTLTIRKWTLLPGVDVATRTLRLRLEVDSAGKTLKPGMNTWLQLNTTSGPMLLVPSQALIDTGGKQWVITVDADGRFVPKRVAVFQVSQGVTALHSGLTEGGEVVSNGLFLVGFEANTSGTLKRVRSENATHTH